MSEERKTPVTLEALMRLKRAEQPPEGFWSRFDQELRSKQLAAIVEKRPWWSAYPRVYSVLLRHRMAFGGATAAAAVLFTVVEFRSNSSAPWLAQSDARPAYASAAPAAVSAPADAVSASTSSTASEVASAPVAASLSRPAALANTFEAEIASMISPRASAPSAVERGDRSTAFSSRPVEASFATLQANEPSIMRNMMALAQGFQAPVATVRAKIIEPLANMTPPSEERRSRLIAETLPMNSGFEATAASVSDHYDSRADDRLYDSINRYGSASIDRSIRF